MTYCVGLKLQDGLVLVSDSRTNAGVDHIASFKKLHVFQNTGERCIFIQSAGNLATTQSVISHLKQAILRDERHLLNVPTLFEVAELVGATIRNVIARDAGHNQGIDFGCSMLVSGQIKGDDTHLFHIYREGNFIESAEETPFFQIGESKYGKPILDRVIDYTTPLPRALQCALISMDSTLRSNLSVGLPLNAVVYHQNSFTAEPMCIDEKNPALLALRQAWSEGLRSVFNGLPLFLEQIECAPKA